MPNGIDSNFFNFDVSAGNRTLMSSVGGNRIETTASNINDVTGYDD